MAKRIVTRAARRDAAGISSRPDIFDALLRRMLVSVNQLQLAANDFGDLASLPKEHVAAGLVVGETTRDLDRLYNDLDRWYVEHEHTPKEVRS